MTGTGNIGIAITTHNRLEAITQSLPAQITHLPPACDRIIIVCDGGRTFNEVNEWYKNNEESLRASIPIQIILSPQTGVATAKNTCLDYLMHDGFNLEHNSHIDHLFLFDDDCWPKVDGWEQPYIQSPEPHLSHSFNLQEIYRDKNLVATHAVGGSMLYYERTVIEQTGGMRLDFGTWGCEHVNLSDRIFNLGLTTFRYADIPEAYDGELFKELDRSANHATNPAWKSSATQQQIDHNRSEGRKLWTSLIHTDITKQPYHEDRDIILTCLFTHATDPQRGRVTGLTIKNIQPLLDSVKQHRIHIFTDDQTIFDAITKTTTNATATLTNPIVRLDYNRWKLYADYLHNTDYQYVWCVDATDVTMNQNPYPHMQPNTLYTGDEPDTLQSEWLHKQGSNQKFLDYINNHPTTQLLNAGLIGGDQQTIRKFATRMWQTWVDDQIDNIQTREHGHIGTDMAALQQIAPQFTISHGPHINNVFKTPIGTDHAWWTHKDPEHARNN